MNTTRSTNPASYIQDPDVSAGRGRAWLRAVGAALVPVVFTAVGSAAGQVLALGDAGSTLLVAVAAALSALVGVLVLRRFPSDRVVARFRAATQRRRALSFLPVAATVVVAAATQGVVLPPAMWVPSLALAAAVAVNEEVWFRGVVLAVLNRIGVRTAIVGSATLFGVLHLANLAGGADLASSALQVVFAAVFGVVAAQLAVLTRSLWPSILWHGAWDLVNLLGGNQASAVALAGVAVAIAIMLGYAAVLGRALRGPGSSDQTQSTVG